MRVLFDYQAFSIQSQGGISRYVLELGARLAARTHGIEPRLYAGWHRSAMLRDAAPAWSAGTHVPSIPKTGPLRHRLNAWLTRRDAERWRPALIHETYFRRGRPYLAGVPTVVTVYDLIYFVLPDLPDAARVRAAQEQAIARADHVICISANTRADLLRFVPVAPERVSVVPLAATAAAASPVGASPEPGPYFLHVGLRHGYKNFDVILQALAASARLRATFTLVAFGGGPFTAEERARIAALGLSDRVVQRPGNDADLDRHYAHARAYVCASRYEGFGLPPLEAMARGCPVVCSDRGSLPEVTGNAALAFAPDDVAGLTAQLESLAADPALATTLGARGRERAALFSWDRCAQETAAIYRRVAG